MGYCADARNLFCVDLFFALTGIASARKIFHIDIGQGGDDTAVRMSSMSGSLWIFLLAVATLSVGAEAALAGQFKRPAYYGAGQRPYKVVTAQFTKTGNSDLAVADYLTDRVIILLGNGDGTFQEPINFAAPAPIALAAGDFNEDGNQDLAVVESGGTGDGAVAIYLGDGDGGFKLSASYAIGVASISLTVADFNGDGHLDVAVTNKGFNNPGNMMTFFGDGHGKLRGRKTYKTADAPFGIAAADLNGDHHPDLVVANLGGYVSVFLNDGTGSFLKPVKYAWNGTPLDVKIADLRNNGQQDLVVADGADGTVVFLNKGNGTFGKPTIYPPTCQDCVAPMACVVADFNLDNKLDVACATNIDDSYLFYGKGEGKFGPSIPINNTIKFQGGFSIAAGNFITNNKAPDLAIPIEEYGKVAILLNNQ
jgi:hypothetical protein